MQKCQNHWATAGLRRPCVHIAVRLSRGNLPRVQFMHNHQNKWATAGLAAVLQYPLGFHSKKADVEPHRKRREKGGNSFNVRPIQQLRGLQHSRAIAKKALTSCLQLVLTHHAEARQGYFSFRQNANAQDYERSAESRSQRRSTTGCYAQKMHDYA